jgi:hypothetical protein
MISTRFILDMAGKTKSSKLDMMTLNIFRKAACITGRTNELIMANTTIYNLMGRGVLLHGQGR